MLYIQAAGYAWCATATAFLFVIIAKSIIDSIGKDPAYKLVLVAALLLLPLSFIALYFSCMALMLVFW